MQGDSSMNALKILETIFVCMSFVVLIRISFLLVDVDRKLSSMQLDLATISQRILNVENQEVRVWQAIKGVEQPPDSD